jgi:hypothetical protein
VLWLKENRKFAYGDRFLVQGWPSALTNNLVLTLGSAPLLGKFLVRVIRDKLKHVRGVQWGDSEVWVNLDYIRAEWQSVMGRSSKVPGDKTLMKALKALGDGERKRMRISKDENPRYWWNVPVDKISAIAEEYKLTDAEAIESTTSISKVSKTVKTEDEERKGKGSKGWINRHTG